MRSRSAFVWKIIYLVAIAVLLIPLSYISQPGSSGAHGGKGTAGGKLSQLRAEHHLAQSQLGQVDPASVTIKLVALGMRGIAANILWHKANQYKMKKDWTNASAAVNQIVKLEPNFISVWKFQGWNLSYNISAEFDDYRERYHWVIRGIDFLREGIRYNEHEPRLYWDVGWFFSQKIGRSDEHVPFRRMFRKDDDLHDNLPREVRDMADIREDPRDNWQVGKAWFRLAEEKAGGNPVKGSSPLVFHSDAPMCQMNYADAIETDGIFGERARRAWRNAAAEWRQYGNMDVPTSWGVTIRLNDREMHEQAAAKLIKKIEAVEPGLREKLEKEKRAMLSGPQRKALEIPPAKRSAKQAELAAAATAQLEVTYKEIARRIQGPRKREALKWAEEASDHQDRAVYTNRYRDIVNFDYWRRRAEIEQTDDMITARKLVYQGNEKFENAELPASRDSFNEGFGAWRRVFDKYPVLLSDDTILDDMKRIIRRYRHVLSQLDEPFPANFPLKDVLEKLKDSK